jgi:hypothetical protein
MYVCVCMCMYVCMYACLEAYVSVDTYASIRTYLPPPPPHKLTHAPLQVVRVFVRVFVRVYVRVYVCVWAVFIRFSSRMNNVPRKVSHYFLFIDFIFLYLALDCIVSHVWCLDMYLCIFILLTLFLALDCIMSHMWCTLAECACMVHNSVLS